MRRAFRGMGHERGSPTDSTRSWQSGMAYRKAKREESSGGNPVSGCRRGERSATSPRNRERIAARRFTPRCRKVLDCLKARGIWTTPTEVGEKVGGVGFANSQGVGVAPYHLTRPPASLTIDPCPSRIRALPDTALREAPQVFPLKLHKAA
jgi:hypothetical protein